MYIFFSFVKDSNNACPFKPGIFNKQVDTERATIFYDFLLVHPKGCLLP